MNTLGKIVLFAVSLSMMTFSVQALEKEQLAQAIKQLEAAQLSLKRAQASTRISEKNREYFDYQAARRDINAIKSGINQYINPSRAIPRDPNASRRLQENYTKLRP
ncbi:MAG: RAQPRD family integrative conjugative element protein [[Pasteurella] mairii]|uniref:Integrative conjugative element protein n=1 Tax=[Pasteurella] mairii TaxID=757 RepID=A0A379B794_9PAST|nr:RAQPRD family integrative conjugative element protein [[Pasteurella] mairii]SUB34457.1 integrative conjugative element protein [[Pasteurella] mairii]